MRTTYIIIHITLTTDVQTLFVHFYGVNNLTPQNLHIRFVNFVKVNPRWGFFFICNSVDQISLH